MTNECERLRPLLFEAVDGELTREERVHVAAHLATCDACRHELEEERALTALLRRPAPARPEQDYTWFRRAAGLLVLLGVAALLASQLGGQAAYGSVTASKYTLSMSIEGGSARPLHGHNHLEVPADSVYQLDVLETARITATGPAILDLDRGEDGWKLVLLSGRVQIDVANGAALVVTSVLGQRILGEGAHHLALDSASFAGRAGVSATDLYQRGIEEFFFAQRMAQAEALFRAALEQAGATEELESSILFYLSAAVGRQERYEEALALKEAWLAEARPEDVQRRGLMLYFAGVYHQRLGNEAEAQACWERIALEDPSSALLDSLPVRAD